MLAVVAIYCVVNVTLQVLVQPKFVSDAVSLSLTLSFFSVIFWAVISGSARRDPLDSGDALPARPAARVDPNAIWARWITGDRVEPDP